MTERIRRNWNGAADGPVSRRRVMIGAGALALALPFAAPPFPASARADEVVRFGLTPVFLTNDLALLTDLRRWLERASGYPVQLVTRRTYQEITALLVSQQLEAAWICGYPFVQFRSQLELLAVPVWQGDTLYQSYLISGAGRAATSIDDLAGDIHAFSDPNSNSGFLVTQALLAERQTTADAFFRRTFFTYGHRNVVRAVSSGLAESGSVDGYVLEVLREIEPGLTGAVEVVHRSEWLGFPPVATSAALARTRRVVALKQALLSMSEDAEGRALLARLRLDGFAERPAALFDPIAAKAALIGTLG